MAAFRIADSVLDREVGRFLCGFADDRDVGLTGSESE